jgi:hypothetical protein
MAADPPRGIIVSWEAVYRQQAHDFDRMGNVASGYGGPDDEVDGHRVANACWAMAGYLRRRADAERAGRIPP